MRRARTSSEAAGFFFSQTSSQPKDCVRKLIVYGCLLAVFALPIRLMASLGGDLDSVHADRDKMQGTLRTTSLDSYTVHEIQTATGILVREYATPSDQVFAVTWKGPFQPDLRQLLGSYFDEFTKAAEAQRSARHGHGPLLIQHSGLVVQVTGHTRSFYGKAYVPQSLPAGVRAEDIQ
jgi:hypothetical protein